MTEVVPLTLTFSRDGVVAPALRAMRRASEIVAFTLNSLADADLSVSPRPKNEATIGLLFGDEPEGYDRKSDFTDWVLERGFRDLAHGVRAALEEAYLYVDFAGDLPGLTTMGELEERFDRVRKAAARLNFMQLMDAVNCGLTEPLIFNDEFLSLQKVRNCLEHRHGIVTDKDANHSSGMCLVLPRLKIFFVREGQEIELKHGQFFEADTAILARRDTRERLFVLGSRVRFTAAEFDEIAMACFFFASDLGQKLPGIVQVPT
jgi:hypothetical protein